jgi:hypothetical protein
MGSGNAVDAMCQQRSSILFAQAVIERPNDQSFDQSNGMCFAELTVHEKLQPKASTLQTVDLPQVTIWPGPVSDPGGLLILGGSPGVLVGPDRASAQALTFPGMSTPHRD